MSNEWDGLAVTWDSPETRLYAQRAFQSWQERVAPLIANLAESRVLDFGCGTGLLTTRLAPYCGHVVAVDTSERMIDALRQKVSDRKLENVTPVVVVEDIALLNTHPAMSERFDIVVASSVCSFLPDYELAFRELASLLRPGGLFTQWDWLGDMPLERIQGAFTASGLASVLVERAFEMTFGDDSMRVVVGVAKR